VSQACFLDIFKLVNQLKSVEESQINCRIGLALPYLCVFLEPLWEGLELSEKLHSA
jgi:hypothetical protein